MIKSKNIVVYDWFDIEQEICSIMAILTNKFRNYHDIVGGDYKDLWHVALKSVVPDSMANDTIVTMFGLESDDEISYFISEHGEWTESFFHAYKKLFDQLDPNFNGVKVNFSW